MAKFDERNMREDVMALSATLSGTTKAEGDWVDMQGFEGLTFVVATGTVTAAGTASGFSFTVEEGDDTPDTGATAVADADLIGLESALTVTSDTADGDLIGSIGYRGQKRFVRMTALGTTGTNAVVSVTGYKTHGGVQGDATIQVVVPAT